MMTSTAATSLPTREKLLRARAASSRLAQLSTAQKNAILMVMADSLETNAEDIIEANRKDLESSGLAGGMRDRLLLDAGRIRLMSEGVRDVAKLPDPTFETLAEWVRPNGLRIRKIRVPPLTPSRSLLKPAMPSCCVEAKRRLTAIGGWWKS